ncbi:pyridoxamine 5'-phosphate oxidase family protein [Microbacterium sp.]|uniref:pyridoxamine 5'-phosphate oxidase family protein n=1 Tax=Microbacterium sp. TaxID=51671 RepID=UPI0025FD7EAE|nr:pyridoxamine 5'-phosphate oxidase family protein [Microbacterium sp.]
MTDTRSNENRGVEHLTTAECWRLMESSSLGRLAVEGTEGVPDLFPVNFIVHDGSVYLRSAPGLKLMDIAARPGVAFEIDGQDPLSHWSVVIKGTARRLDSDAEIHESGVEKLGSASPAAKQDFIRITPDSVTGRRFRKDAAPAPGKPAPSTTTGSHQPVRPPENDEGWPGANPAGGTRPIPIPHFPPRPTH